MRTMNGTVVVLASIIGLGLGAGSCTEEPAGPADEPAAQPQLEEEKVAAEPVDKELVAKDTAMEPAPAAPMKKAEAAPGGEIGGKGGSGAEGEQRKPATWKRSTRSANTSKLMVGDDLELPLSGMQLDVRVDGFRARVLIDFYFFNDHPQQFEGTFKLRLPDGASPWFLAFGQTRLRAAAVEAPEEPAPLELAAADVVRKRELTPERVVADREAEWEQVKVARMVPREQAARAYTETVRRRVDPALLEWSGSGVFSARVFPIAPHRRHRIVVGYDMDLTRVGDALELALPLPDKLPRVALDLDVAALDGVRAELEPAAEATRADGRWHFRLDDPDKPVKLRLEQAPAVLLSGRDEGAGAVFATRLRPQLPASKAVATAAEAVFLVDVSMSSNPDKFPVWLELMRRVLEANRGSLKRFNVLFFNVETFWYAAQMQPNQPERVAALMQFCQQLVLEGATDLGAAIRAAVAGPPGAEGAAPARDLFLLSDGSITWGQDEAFALSKLAGAGQRGALFAYRSGMAGSDTRMLTHLARETGGAVFSVVGEHELAAAASAHSRRPWQLVRAELAGCHDLLLAGRPRFLFPGQRLLLAGRGAPPAGARLELQLRQGQREQTLKLPLVRRLASPLAPRIYGQVAVGQLEDFVEAVGDEAGAYARHFRVTGKTTSLLMLDSEADYQRYGIQPEDDAELVAERQVRHLVAAALDALFSVLGDPKHALEVFLGKLAELDGVELELPTELRAALAKLPERLFEQSAPPLACKRHDRQGIPEEVLDQLEKRQPGYDTLAAEARRRKRALGAADGLKALSSLIEANPGDGVLARDVGYSATQWGLAGHALHLFQRVARRRPHEPQTYRALARTYQRLGKPDMALLWYEVGLAGRWDARFGEFKRILMLDYLRFLQALDPQALHQALRGLAMKRRAELPERLGIDRADLLVSITWNTDGTDVDLHVIEPTGEECFYSHPETAIGGELTQDVTQGYGPEMYLLPEAKPGEYTIRAKYFASDAKRAETRTKVQATIYRYWGTKKEKVTEKLITLETGKQMHDLAIIEMPHLR